MLRPVAMESEHSAVTGQVPETWLQGHAHAHVLAASPITSRGRRRWSFGRPWPLGEPRSWLPWRRNSLRRWSRSLWRRRRLRRCRRSFSSSSPAIHRCCFRRPECAWSPPWRCRRRRSWPRCWWWDSRCLRSHTWATGCSSYSRRGSSHTCTWSIDINNHILKMDKWRVNKEDNTTSYVFQH